MEKDFAEFRQLCHDRSIPADSKLRMPFDRWQILRDGMHSYQAEYATLKASWRPLIDEIIESKKVSAR